MKNIVALVIFFLIFSSLSWAQTNDSLLYFGPSERRLGSNIENLQTDYYQVQNFGMFGALINEKHDVWYYPTPDDFNDAGYFSLDAHNAALADFNNDGLEDIVISWAIFPHTIERQSRSTFTILLNDGNGGVRYAPEMFESIPVRFFSYRTSVADFNMDGQPDIVAASMGMIKRNSDGTYSDKFEPIPLALSQPNGKFRDASANIEGQEDGGLPEGYTFGHELSVGDVNDDGFPDFYTGGCLFLNNGEGMFTNASSQLPDQMRSYQAPLMHSLIGDLDGDGIDDIVAAYFDGAPENKSGYILLSNGHVSLEQRTLVSLPPGLYGAGVTKFNHGVLYDVNNDGRLDIVFSVTRSDPYYEGRGLQVIINNGDKTFTDQTSKRVVSHPAMDSAQGEGSLFVADVDGDGVSDLVHSGSPSDVVHSVAVYLNVDGKLRIQSFDDFPYVQRWQIDGFEDLREWNTTKMGRGYPINLDNQQGIDFIATIDTPLQEWPQNEPNEYILYSIISNEPLVTSVKEVANVPIEISLSQNYPNPFNPTTVIRYHLPQNTMVQLKVFDMLGREVASLVNAREAAGSHIVHFDASHLSSGMYTYRLSTNAFSTARKMLLIK